jgi:large subunit ribosomal protein L7/L12
MADKKITQDELMGAIENMSVLELSELVKALEEKFGVTAAAPVMAAGAAPAAAASGEAQEEQTIFNVIIANGGANKLQVIKTLRELVPTLGLKEAKDLVDGAPKEVMSQVNKKTADEAKEKLTAAGATVELK